MSGVEPLTSAAIKTAAFETHNSFFAKNHRPRTGLGLWTLDFGLHPYNRRVIRNIIFDWSGTLVDDLPAVWEATNHVFKEAGLAELTLEEFRAEFCLPFKKFYDKFLPHVAPDQLELWFHGKFKECQDSVVPLPHAREFLQFCRARELRTFVLSAVHRQHWTAQAEVAAFAEFIDDAFVGVLDKREKIQEILKKH